MKSLVAASSMALLAALVAAPPAPAGEAQPAPRPHFGFSNDQMGVLMETTMPTGQDPHEHVRFTRYAGEGQRQVRIVERQTAPRTPRVYSDAVKLEVGEKTVFTTVGALPCSPEQHPMKVALQMRVKLPGRDWWPWFTYSQEFHVLMFC